MRWWSCSASNFWTVPKRKLGHNHNSPSLQYRRYILINHCINIKSKYIRLLIEPVARTRLGFLARPKGRRRELGEIQSRRRSRCSMTRPSWLFANRGSPKISKNSPDEKLCEIILLIDNIYKKGQRADSSVIVPCSACGRPSASIYRESKWTRIQVGGLQEKRR